MTSQNFVCIEDFEKNASSTLPKYVFDFYKSGAGEELTVQENRNAFSKYKIRPRCLRNVSIRNLSTTILNQRVALPIGIAPTAMQKLAHPDGECASARDSNSDHSKKDLIEYLLKNPKASQKRGTVFILSTLSNCTIEEVADAAPDAIKWFQLYIYKDRNITLDLVKRAELAGFKALVLTVDVPVPGIRLADIRNRFTLPPHLKIANLEGSSASKMDFKGEDGSKMTDYVVQLFDQSLQWEDVKWLQKITKLPIILKGILTAEDAFLAADLGVAGIIVSNHGGRQLDGVAASIDVLSEIVQAVGDRLEIYFDGGIRTGSDVLKVLALGAKMVFLGRPVLWGLAQGGERGVEAVLEILKNDFENSLALSGCSSVDEIKPSIVVHETFFPKL